MFDDGDNDGDGDGDDDDAGGDYGDINDGDGDDEGSPVGQIIKRPLGSGLRQHTLTIYSALPRSPYP